MFNVSPFDGARWPPTSQLLRQGHRKFLEIGTDKDHVHFLVQSVPKYSVTKIVTMLKSITAKEIFKRWPQVRKKLWGGEFWTDGIFRKHGRQARR